MPFQLFAWIASVVYGFEAITGKITSKHRISNPWFFNFIWCFVLLILTLPIALTNSTGLPSHWPSILIAGMLTAVASTFYILTLYYYDVSVLAPLYTLRTAFAAILSVFILGELLSFNQYIFIAIIFLGGLFVNIDERLNLKSFSRKPLLLLISYMLSLAFYSVFMGNSINHNGFWVTTLWTLVIQQIILLITLPLFYKEIKLSNSLNLWPILLMGLFGTLGNLAGNKAYENNVSISVAIISLPTSMFFAAFFSFFAPNLLEKHSLKVYLIRFAAATVMILAALKLTL